MPEINLLCDLPKAKRNLQKRNESQELQRDVALKFGREYFDGDRTQGYGGYRYDGRWIPVAKRFVEHWGLKAGDRVLDIGCAKGFLVKDLMTVCPGLDVRGIDISSYAIDNSEPEIRDRLMVADARKLPFNDGSFKAAICINKIRHDKKAIFAKRSDLLIGKKVAHV
jgi:cyclopropane fatty-acyl-phospholipid synthase-like methyltransferase